MYNLYININVIGTKRGENVVALKRGDQQDVCSTLSATKPTRDIKAPNKFHYLELCNVARSLFIIHELNGLSKEESLASQHS